MREKPNKLTSLAALRVLALGWLAVVPLAGCSQTASSEAGNWMAPSSRSDLASIQTETSSVALITALSELEPEGRRFAFAADVDVMQPVRRADPALSAADQIKDVLAQVGLAARDEGETIHVERMLAKATEPSPEVKDEAVEVAAANEAPVVMLAAAAPAEQSKSEAPVVAEAQPAPAPEPAQDAPVLAAAALAQETLKGTPVRHPKDQKSPTQPEVAATAREQNVADLIAADERKVASAQLGRRTLMGTPIIRKGDRQLAPLATEIAASKPAQEAPAATQLAQATVKGSPVPSAGDAASAEPANIEALIAEAAADMRAQQHADTPAPAPEQAEAAVAKIDAAPPEPAAETAAPVPEQAEAKTDEQATAAPVSAKPRKSWGRKQGDEAAVQVQETAPAPVIEQTAAQNTEQKTEQVAEVVAPEVDVAAPAVVVAEAAAPAPKARKVWGRKAAAEVVSSAPAQDSEKIGAPDSPQTVAALIEANPAAAAPALAAPVLEMMRVPAHKPMHIVQAAPEPLMAGVAAQEPAAPAVQVAAAEAAETPAEPVRRKSWTRKSAKAEPIALLEQPAEGAAAPEAAPVMASEPVEVAPAEVAKAEPVTLAPVEAAAAPEVATPAPVAVAEPAMPAVKVAVPPVKPSPIVQAALVMPDEETISDHVVTAVQSANAQSGLDTAMGVDTHPEHRTLKASKAVKLPDVWSAKRGQTLRATLSDWCDRQGVQLIWRTEYDYPLAADIMLEGNFETAVRGILQGFAAAAPQPVGRLHRQGTAGTAVLIISSRGNDYGEN